MASGSVTVVTSGFCRQSTRILQECGGKGDVINIFVEGLSAYPTKYNVYVVAGAILYVRVHIQKF